MNHVIIFNSPTSALFSFDPSPTHRYVQCSLIVHVSRVLLGSGRLLDTDGVPRQPEALHLILLDSTPQKSLSYEEALLVLCTEQRQTSTQGVAIPSDVTLDGTPKAFVTLSLHSSPPHRSTCFHVQGNDLLSNRDGNQPLSGQLIRNNGPIDYFPDSLHRIGR